MTKKPNHFWIVVLFLGWTFDFLFWDNKVGVNFPVFLTLCLLGGFYLLLTNKLYPAPQSLWLLVPYVFFAVFTVLREEPLTSFLANLFMVLSLGLLAVTYLGGRWFQYNLFDYFKKFIFLIDIMLNRPRGFAAQIQKEQAERNEKKKGFPFRQVVRGLLIAIPIVAVLATLLASADLVFSQRLAEFIDQINVGNIIEQIFRLVLIMSITYLLTGVILNAGLHSKDEKLSGEDKPVIGRFLGFIETTIILGSVIALYLTFVIIQFQYFFGGEGNIGVDGYSYSQYARRGFNELLIVAFISLLLIIGLSTITKRETETERRVYSGLSVVIAAEVMVILVSSYQRLMLGIDWHGFSRLRLYPRVFLIWVGILFIAVVALEIYKRERYFTFAGLLASLGFAVSISLLNVDASIVKHNVFRAGQGRHFNVPHLASLSTDGVPALADEFQDSSLSTEIHEGVGAALVCQQFEISNDPAGDWFSFNYSRWKAEEIFTELEDQLEEYRLNENSMRVRTPSGNWYNCQESE